MLLLFILTIFVSAVLLFLIQPLFANLILPLLGGSPAVWNTATMFYQSVLLLGYVYAHLVKTKLTPKAQAIVHTIVVLSPLAVLPIAVPLGWAPPTNGTPILWLVGLLGTAVALPFFVLSTTSSLTQAWFARISFAGKQDPYLLYIASNIGSMIGLLGYPLLMQPTLRLQSQSWLWSAGYALLAVLLITTTWFTWVKSRGLVRAAAEAPVDPALAPAWLKRVRWIALAFVPSSLMLSVTTYVSTDITPVPLLWVIPLALYLLTFILVFARRQILPAVMMRMAMQLLLIFLTVALFVDVSVISPKIMIPLHMLAFFVITMVCHGQLAADRPHPAFLTEFYLWMSIGGALGGIFNGFVAPMLFTRVVEYPLVLTLPALLVGLKGLTRVDLRKYLRADLAFAALVAGVMSLLIFVAREVSGNLGRALMISVFALTALLCTLISTRALRYGIGMAALFITGVLWADVTAMPALTDSGQKRLDQRRSFFGVNSTFSLPANNVNLLVHGSTIHGGQFLEASRRCEPMLYYARHNPIGTVFEARESQLGGANIGVVGLGTGVLGGYAKPGQHWTFYEIDPDVKAIAEDPKLFTFLSECAPNSKVVLGDARLQLARESAAAKYNMLILDAYSSDAIPIHLITKEALMLYQSRIDDDGLILFHISNNYFDLRPVLGNLAQATGMVALTSNRALDQRWWTPGKDAPGDPKFRYDAAAGQTPAHWVVLAKNSAALKGLDTHPDWQPLSAFPEKPLWTDDFSSLLSAFKEKPANK
jgi:hypothetical protein